MGLFLRRTVQRCIDELLGCVSLPQLQQVVRALNGKNDRPLAAEWELVILWALSRCYAIQYEEGHPNDPKVDLTVRTAKKSPPLFSADICCVSDHGYRVANPVERLQKMIADATLAAGLSGQKGWQVGGATNGKFRDAKMKLHLPKDEAAWTVLGERLTDFFSQCKSAKGPRRLDLSDLAPQLVVTFDPQGRYITGSHPSFTTTYSVHRNPVATALRRKRKQLARSGASGLSGTILCDAGCSLINERSSPGVGACSLKDVIFDFLRDAPDIDFVFTLGVISEYPPPYLGKEKHQIKPTLFSLKEPQSIKPVHDALFAMADLLPPPQNSPDNIRAWYIGGVDRQMLRSKPMSRSENQVSVSARWLMELLAGRISLEEALKRYTLDPSSSDFANGNPFRRMLESGRLPSNIEVAPGSDVDDDAITFKFGPPDPAISPFTIRR